NYLPTFLERLQRAGLVMSHEPAIAHHIGGKDRGEAALDALFGHLARLPLENAVAKILGLAFCGVYRSGLPVMGWSGRAPAPPAIEAGEGAPKTRSTPCPKQRS